jgi:nucleoside-diphosphate-sugar epimerase
MSSVLVFGASSYVGQMVTGHLVAAGHKVTAVSRRPSSARILLLPFAGDVDVVSNDDASAGAVQADAVVNFAYVKDAQPQVIYASNKALVDAVDSSVRSCGADRLVHISTLTTVDVRGVYGRAERVRWRPAGAYTEAKIHAEHLLEKARARGGYSLSILRLGNVLGPASPLWVAGLAQRILEGKPTMPERPGFSNTTYVRNVAGYVERLLSEARDALEAFGYYHHLGELGEYSWGQVLGHLADGVGRPCVMFPPPVERAGGLRDMTANALRRAYERRVGSYARLALVGVGRMKLTEKVLFRSREVIASSDAEPATAPLAPEDEGLRDLLSADSIFRPHTVEGWRPPVDFRSAMDEIRDWVARAGYALDEPGEAPLPDWGFATSP